MCDDGSEKESESKRKVEKEREKKVEREVERGKKPANRGSMITSL